MRRRAAFVMVGLVVVAFSSRPAAAGTVRWYVVHQALSERGTSLALGDAVQEVRLNGGWSCVIGATSKALPTYEARETTCSNGDKSFSFSVQCEPGRPNDHAQIRFRNLEKRPVDFVEVGCELRE